jgi:acyl-CoA reductase-like NAD-dependent aldehyde dehydrogenase
MQEIQCISPVDGSLFARRSCASAAEIEAALSRAAESQRQWRSVDIAERGRLCLAAIDAMLAERDAIVPELAWQMGRPVRYGSGELNGLEERGRYMIAIANEALAPIEIGGKDGFARAIWREPLGLVLVVAPWNYPYLTAVNSIIPALMAGNAVVLKHAAQTPLVAERFQSAFDRAGLPRGLFQHLFLGHDQTAALIAAGRFDQVNFTGSVAGGQAVERAAAGTFTGLGLELGGKDPAYVRADADLPFTIENLVDGAFFNSGQSCCAIERIYIHAKVFDDVLAGMIDLTRQYVLGDPLDPQTSLGPMVRPASADFVRGQIDEAKARGARAHVDARSFPRDNGSSAYLAPQILTQVDHMMSVMREESFGPVVGLMKVNSDEEAVEFMNDSRYGLSASLWTRDSECAQALAARLETGTVFVNRCDYLDPALAWTGVKETGRGVTLSRLGYETLTRPKSWHCRLR